MLCLFALGAAIFPRLALLSTWIVTPLVSRAFYATWLLPLLGILFLPFTTLLFVLVWTAPFGVIGLAWFWVFLGFVIDLSAYTSGSFSNRNRDRVPGIVA